MYPWIRSSSHLSTFQCKFIDPYCLLSPSSIIFVREVDDGQIVDQQGSSNAAKYQPVPIVVADSIPWSSRLRFYFFRHFAGINHILLCISLSIYLFIRLPHSLTYSVGTNYPFVSYAAMPWYSLFCYPLLLNSGYIGGHFVGGYI